MSDEALPIIPFSGNSLAQIGPQGGRIVAEMVSGALALTQASKALVPRFIIGEHVFCEPDYRQIVIWSQAMELTPEEVLAGLLVPNSESGFSDYKTNITDGRLIRVSWATKWLPLKSFEWVPGLVIESWVFWGKSKLGCVMALPLPKLKNLDCRDCGLTGLDLSAVPMLTRLVCFGNRLTELDLSAVPVLTELSCAINQLTMVDLSAVPMLTRLGCGYNPLTKLDLSTVPMLTELRCFGNQLTELDLSAVPMLTDLRCFDNQLTKLDLSAVPMLTWLLCESNPLTKLDLSTVPMLTELRCLRNQLTELDIRPLLKLDTLYYDEEKTRLIQRSAPNF